jgi:hypothetical protein
MADKRVSPAFAAQMSMRPDACIPAGSWSFTGGTYAPTHNGVACKCKGAEVKEGGTAGILMVHYVRDAAGVYSPMCLRAGVPKGGIFDDVLEAGTTVDIAEVSLFPV